MTPQARLKRAGAPTCRSLARQCCSPASMVPGEFLSHSPTRRLNSMLLGLLAATNRPPASVANRDPTTRWVSRPWLAPCWGR